MKFFQSIPKSLLTLAVFWPLVSVGCNSKPEKAVQKGNEKVAQKEGKSKISATDFDVPEIAPVLGSVPDFKLTDQNGQSYGSEDLKGNVWIANFIFTSCKSTCPEQTQKLKEFQDKLLAREKASPNSWDGIRLVSFTVDPSTDTPEVLKKYAESNGADSHWKFLTGSRDDLWSLCEKGFMLPVAENKEDTAMPIAHSSRFVVVDRMMQIRGFFDGTDVAEIRKMERAFFHVEPEMSPPSYAAEIFAGQDNITHLAGPPEVATTHWMKERQVQQLATKDSIQSFVDFQFQDKRIESGISYNPQIVDEQRWRMQVNHYDHGNGVSIADVDGDGRFDLYFTSQATRNELWRNLGGGEFEDVTESAGVSVEGKVSVSASFADIDNDGDADLFVTTTRGGNHLFLNDGNGKFTDVTEGSGLDYSGHSSGAVFFDYDRDGKLDLFVTNVGKFSTQEHELVRHDQTSALPEDDQIKYYLGVKNAFLGHLNEDFDEPSLLYHNEGGGKFKEVTQAMNVKGKAWSGDATPMDANGDGWIDLYVLSMQGHDEYYENIEGKRFENKTDEVFKKTPWGAMGVKAFDFNNDLNIDLFLTDMHSDMAEDVTPDREKNKSNVEAFGEEVLRSNGKSIYGNAFFKGDGEGNFSEVSDAIGAENYWPWGLSIADLNADGYQDAFVASSMCFPYRYGVNSVLINEGGKKFADAEFIVGVEPRPDGRTIKPWFELDADGIDKSHPYCKDRTGKVIVWSALGTRSSAIFDLDDDGDLDIVTSEFNSKPMVLLSNLSEKKTVNFLKIRLKGSDSNRDALGAKVVLKMGDKKIMQVYDGVSGYLSHSLYPLYFGLGEAVEVDEIAVTWPNGKLEVMPGPFKSNQMLEFDEGE